MLTKGDIGGGGQSNVEVNIEGPPLFGFIFGRYFRIFIASQKIGIFVYKGGGKVEKTCEKNYAEFLQD